jgi:hypothetical protein
MRPCRILALLAIVTAGGVLAVPGDAVAGDRHRGHGDPWWYHGRGWGPPPHVYHAPPPRYYPRPQVYYAPPPVYYMPPPRLYYAPPPAYYYVPAPGISLTFRF